MKKFAFFLLGLVAVDQFVDSMLARGFAIDSAASDSGRTVVFASENEPYRVLAAFSGNQLQVIQESYIADNNDSTRVMWQRLRTTTARVSCGSVCATDWRKSSMLGRIVQC